MKQELTESEFSDEKLRIARRMKPLENSEVGDKVIMLKRILEEKVNTTIELASFRRQASLILGIEV